MMINVILNLAIAICCIEAMSFEDIPSTFTYKQPTLPKTDEEADMNYPDEQRLIANLLGMYDTAARPVFNASKAVVIKFSLSLIQILDMVILNDILWLFNVKIIHFKDERNQILTSNVWIEQVIKNKTPQKKS